MPTLKWFCPIVTACLLLATAAKAATIVPMGTYEGHMTTICQAAAQNSTTSIIQSSVTPIYSSVSLQIAPGNTASFDSAQHLVTNNLISSSIESNGGINQGIGILTFTPSTAGATSGKITGHVVQASGSLILSSDSANAPSDFALGSQTIKGTYSATATTLTLTIDKPQTYQVLYFKPSAAGVPTDITLIGLSGTNQSCTVTGHFSLN
jgi:hypothetical protein